MSNLVQVATDPRSVHGTQSLIRSSLGMSPETGQSGYDSRIEAGAQYIAPISVNMDTQEVKIYDLPPGTYIPAYIMAEGAGGTLGTVQIELLDAAGAVQSTPLIAGSVASPGQWTALDAIIDTFPADEPHSIRVTPINGATATGIATMALQMLPLITAWK